MTTALDELRALPQWVAFRLIPSQKRPGKTDKIPVNPHNGKNASVTNPETWGTYDQAIDRACSDELGGVGFVFTSSDPYIGIDLDGCIEGGELEPWALAIIERLASYTETSPSGNGSPYHHARRAAGRWQSQGSNRAVCNRPIPDLDRQDLRRLLSDRRAIGGHPRAA